MRQRAMTGSRLAIPRSMPGWAAGWRVVPCTKSALRHRIARAPADLR